MLLENILILSLQHVLRLLLPLLVIPIVARSTSNTDFGIYMYAVSAATWLATLLEYGFSISATRAVAGVKSTETLREVVSATQSAKVLLVLISAGVGLLLWLLVPAIGVHWQWSVAAWFLGVLIALQPNYYFQGREQLRLVGLVELAVGAATIVLVLLLVRAPEHFFRLPLVLVLTRVASFVCLTLAMQRAISSPWSGMFRLSAGWQSLRAGLHVFVFQGAVSLYTTFNVIFLGFLVPPEQIGPYATAERLMRAGLGFFAQISAALFSRLSALRDIDPEAMARTRRRSVRWMVALGLAGGALALTIGPLLAHALLGAKADQVGSIIHTMAWVVPAIAISNALGFQYLLVNHLERAFNRVILAAVVLSLPTSYLLVCSLGPQGMALSWVTIEWFIAIALIALVRYSNNALKKN